MPKIKVALIGVGNCASAFLQGLSYYGKTEKAEDFVGLRNPTLAGYVPNDIAVVAAFDVDDRKIGLDLSEAIYAESNNTPQISQVPKTGVIVNKGSLLDGVGESTKQMIHVSNKAEVDIVKILKESGAEIVINLLPSGAVKATEYYAKQAIAARCAFINATPNFIASDPAWEKQFKEANLPLVGDDLVDQIGSTALHKTLLKLLSGSGVKITETYQLDVGGGAESVDTLERTRDAKRTIKTEAVASALPYKTQIVAGSTDYVDFLQNKRDSYFYIDGVYFCNTPIKIDLKFQTVDAPNAGSVLLDVVRAVKVAITKKQTGAIETICAYGFKRPPKTSSIATAEEDFKRYTTNA
ncbi:MAG: inositol-3-phosphate synthase [Candidatus Bathyarchaeota archaeon]|nr:inositol-3-phosphate synthase [Candidatus Termiticorpusculum sp.]MCL1970502.1 inositol-3-phosphate synthase [Candidatus Termiticorpusculum sp.]